MVLRQRSHRKNCILKKLSSKKNRYLEKIEL